MSTASTTYYLQTPEGIQGPVHLDTLRHRAAINELNGDSQIATSEEGPWIAAGKLTELELEWRVKDDEGQDRPLCHILALRSQVESGEVQPFWEIFHDPSGEDYQVVDALCSALLAQNRVLEAKIQRTPSEPAPPPVEEETSTDESPRDLRVARDEAVHEAAKWKRLYEDEVERNRDREQSLLQQIEELRAWQRKGSSKIRALERREEQLEELLRLPGEESSETGGDRDLTTAYHELHLQLEHLMDSIHLRAGQLEEERERTRELTLQLNLERTAHQEELEEKNTLQSETLDQLSKLEQGHTDLIRAYRELHDRFLHLRNQKQLPETASDSSPEETPAPAAVPSKLDMM